MFSVANTASSFEAVGLSVCSLCDETVVKGFRNAAAFWQQFWRCFSHQIACLRMTGAVSGPAQSYRHRVL